MPPDSTSHQLPYDMVVKQLLCERQSLCAQCSLCEQEATLCCALHIPGQAFGGKVCALCSLSCERQHLQHCDAIHCRSLSGALQHLEERNTRLRTLQLL